MTFFAIQFAERPRLELTVTDRRQRAVARSHL